MTTGQTGRALIDPVPCISPQQAEWDKRKFMAMHGNTASGCEWINEALRLRESGWSDAAIARELHKSHKTIVNHLGRSERKGAGRMPEHERQEKIARAIEMWAGGHTLADIAKATGVRYQTASNWLKSRGLK